MIFEYRDLKNIINLRRWQRRLEEPKISAGASGAETHTRMHLYLHDACSSTCSGGVDFDSNLLCLHAPV